MGKKGKALYHTLSLERSRRLKKPLKEKLRTRKEKQLWVVMARKIKATRNKRKNPNWT